MKSVKHRTVAVVLFDVALLALGVMHLPSVLHRPTVPFTVSSDSGGVHVDLTSQIHPSGGLRANDRLTAWRDQRVTIPEAVEFLADFEVVGDRVPVTYVRDGLEARTTVTLVPFYSTPRFVVIMFFVGLLTWVVAVVVAWSAGPGLPARVLHWTVMVMSVTLMLNYGAMTS